MSQPVLSDRRLSPVHLRMLIGVLALLQLFAYGLPWYDQYGGREASGWEVITVGAQFGGEVVSPILYVGATVVFTLASLLTGVIAVLGRAGLGRVVAMANLVALGWWVVLFRVYWDTRWISDLFNPVGILPASATVAVLFAVAAVLGIVWRRRGRVAGPAAVDRPAAPN